MPHCERQASANSVSLRCAGGKYARTISDLGMSFSTKRLAMPISIFLAFKFTTIIFICILSVDLLIKRLLCSLGYMVSGRTTLLK